MDETLKTAKPILFNTEMVKAILDGRKTVTRRILKPHNAVKAKKCEYEQGEGLWFDDSFNQWDKDTHIKDYSVSPCWIETRIYIEKYAPYKVGDILYVRETWKRFCGVLYGWENGTYIPIDDFEGYQYKSDKQCVCTKGINPFCDDFEDQKSDIRFDDKWKPSIHMPKEAARIFLKVTDVRVERLQDITEEQAKCEGACKAYPYIDNTGELAYMQDNNATYLGGFQCHWDSIVKKSDLEKYSWKANPFVWVIEFERA